LEIVDRTDFMDTMDTMDHMDKHRQTRTIEESVKCMVGRVYGV